MTPPETLSERQVFEAALRLEGEAREAYLVDLGAGDAERERRVRALLSAHERPELAPTPSQPFPLPLTGRQRVGPYRLLEQVGEGGMGVVYVAEQMEPVRRKVALKLIKAGMASKELLGRFQSERQVLALMSHPNIARILDAGSTEDGLPYFVMEYVQGVPLLDYCDRRQLSVDERLDLFVDICDAVQHAHQKGVIHRDLKPSNILVEEIDGRATPKVIDFGVAKALHQRLGDVTLHTRLGGIIGTPEYVSPEQAETSALDVDTRADVYSLGAVLYELTTGLRPFDFSTAGFAEIQRTLAERDPKPPSARVREGGEAAFARAKHRRTDTDGLLRKLRGDLDWITMRALEKDRQRRYATASELAADLERHRTHQAVLARPPSTTYLVSRFVRRHSLLLTMVTLVTLALVAGTIGTSVGLVRARHEAERARVSAAIAEEVNAFLNDDLLAAVAPEEQGIDVSMRQVLDTAAERIEGRFPDQPRVEAALRRTIGRTYNSLGVLDAAEHHFLRALELFEGSLGPEHPETRDVQRWLGEVYRAEGRLDDAERALEAALGGDPPASETEHLLRTAALQELAHIHVRAGRYRESEAFYLEALETLETLEATYGREDPDTLEVMGNLATAYRYMERWEEAERLLREVLEAQRRLRGPEHPSTLLAANKLSALYLGWKRYDQAEELIDASLGPTRRVMGEEHPWTLIMANNLAWLNLEQGRYGEAEELLLETYEVKRRTLGELHPSTVEGLQNLVILYETMDAPAKRAEYTARWADTLRRVVDGPTARTEDRLEYADLLLTAEAPEIRDPYRAVSLARQAVEDTDRADAAALAILARAYEATGDRDRAVAIAREALEVAAEGSEVRAELEALLGGPAS